MISKQYFFVIATLLLGLHSCQNNKTQEKTINDNSDRQFVNVPGKKPLLLLTDRPYNLETPLKYFKEDFTPNDIFFVRWHLSNLPLNIDIDTFHLRISGNLKTNLSLTMNDLKTKFKAYSINALCVCAGNARSLFKPGVPGIQWVNGGMGNARWTGVKLKDIIEMAGSKEGSECIAFNGMDSPPMETVPDFIKSLPFEHAIAEEVLIAYEMNGEPLPLLNGYPLKLVVPGWYATYWVGMLNEINVLKNVYKGYWMDKAYLIPRGISNGNESPSSLSKNLEPINKIDLRSIFVTPEPGAVYESGKTIELEGLAFDGGDGVSKVEISMDNGKTWISTQLDSSLGKYSWRRWRFSFQPKSKGIYELFVKATGTRGEVQPWHQWNRSGYMRNEIESISIKVKGE